ncbi:hypothetical protein ITP53_31295 [Nonomuraea sp. K274]|uniref:Short subunit dehydrogenase n=1 Tax=Nonomuraea cypriaca TaxID=1187855 RepID=A0A931F3T1_9ACTN|nr:hypothetical protein [Nonomuraea cypriaca]MBF8190133.1 hypothetical protein [Nonomuraea cypriaca]
MQARVRGSVRGLDLPGIQGNTAPARRNSAVYSAAKFAVRALAEGLRKEQQDIRVTLISSSFTESEPNTLGGDPDTMAWVRTLADKLNMPAATVAEAIAHAVEQPASIDVSEIVIRPVAEAAA